MLTGWEPESLLRYSSPLDFPHCRPCCYRRTRRCRSVPRSQIEPAGLRAHARTHYKHFRQRSWHSASISTRPIAPELNQTNLTGSKAPAAGAAIVATSSTTALDPDALGQDFVSSLSAQSNVDRRTTTQLASEEDTVLPLLNGGKPLKINLDLLLYRCRQQRQAAMFTLDSDKRKQLLQQLEADLKVALAMDPEDGRAYVSYGRLLVQQRRYEEARKLYAEGCVATGNVNPYIWCSWAHLEAKLGSVSRARKLFDAALVVDSKHVGAWHGWGVLEKSQGNYTRACDLWMKGIRQCKNQCLAYLYCSLAVLAAELGRVEEARAWFEEGTKTMAGKVSHVLWHAWAMMEAEKGDKSAVRYLFKKSLQCQPKSRYVHLAWAKFEQQQGNLAQAEQLLLRGISINSTDAALYQALAVLQKQLRNAQAARMYFQQGLQADPSHIPLWQAYAMLEAEEGHLDKARALLQQGIWADPQHPDCVYVFQAWGILEKAVGNHAFARELFKCAIKVDPCNEPTWVAWIDMEETLGELDKAAELRSIRQAGSYEFAVPANFTTRPGESGGRLDSFSGFLASWFKDFSSKRASRSRPKTLREFLPEDFEDELRVEDVIVDLDPLKLAEAKKAQRSRWHREGGGPFDSVDETMVAEYKARKASLDLVQQD